MNCDELAERLTELMDGEMNDTDEAAALEHLGTCVSCERVLAETRETVRIVHDHGRVDLDEADRQRMMDSIRTELTDGLSGTS